MLKSDFYYDLPQELIAQTPLEPRDSSRLMKIDRKSGEITHDRFYNICDYLERVTCSFSTTQRFSLQDFTA